MEHVAPGTLFLVSTPIGNLEDLSPRARRVLEEVDLVACEDTRHTGRLLSQLGVQARLISLHEHNESQRLPQLLAQLEGGESIAVVSDAGTPLLADPGFLLAREAAARGLTLSAIPGASAPLAALAISGLPPYPFTFYGFAPRKAGKRKTFLEWAGSLGHTVVFFESPHRVLQTLAAMDEVLPDHPVALCRELTKMHEEVLRGSAGEIANTLGERAAVKGEIVLVLGPAPKKRESKGHGTSPT